MTQRANETEVVTISWPTLVMSALYSILARIVVGFAYAAGAIFAARLGGVI
jgi:hypothetical protein